MTGDRWAEIEAGRDADPAKLRPPPEVDVAMLALADNGDFRIILKHYKELLWRSTVERAAPNVSALLEIEGARNLIRDIETHVARVVNARSGRKPDPE